MYIYDSEAFSWFESMVGLRNNKLFGKELITFW
jgi:hypothetical protein